jgi:hypothetical protein
VSQLCLGSLGTRTYLRGLLVPFQKDFLSFFYFPYGTSCIPSFILWVSLLYLVPYLRLGDSRTLFSCPSGGSFLSPCLPALHVLYLNSSFNHQLHKVASSQQLWPTQYPQISNNDLVLQHPSPTLQWWTMLQCQWFGSPEWPLGHRPESNQHHFYLSTLLCPCSITKTSSTPAWKPPTQSHYHNCG